MSHRFHPDRRDRADALLFDDCEDCDRRARDLGLGLDEERFELMWRRMLDVEYDESGAYRSTNESILGKQLYQVSLLVQRHPVVSVVAGRS